MPLSDVRARDLHFGAEVMYNPAKRGTYAKAGVV